jgi:DNA-binding CsgD family transcriptional regulator
MTAPAPMTAPRVLPRTGRADLAARRGATSGRGTHLAVVRPSGRPAVSGHAGVDAALASAGREVLITTTLAAVDDPIAMLRRIDHENVGRGVRYRVLFPDRARTAPGLAGRLAALALAGAEVRTMPQVPMDAIVVDGQLAVLPSDHGDGRSRGVAMFRLPSVVSTTVELFERVWPTGVGLTGADLPEEPELTGRERELLGLLCAGCTDESAAARLGISVRTVRRMVSGIMNRLGARSRFQAGVKAADRGWFAANAGTEVPN